MLTTSQAAELLRAFDNVLILTHVRPDGDTVGCAAALCAGLRRLGKTAYLLPNPELTDTTAPYFRPYEALEGFAPDKVVSTDIATVGLFPENAKPYADRVDLAIDHHPSFESFGRENIVRPEAAACGELVYDILAHLGPITAEIALPLYVAVSTDTGCFAYANTTAQTHAVAAALLRTGIDYQTVNKVFFRTKSRKRMQLEAAILNDCEFYDHDRVAVLSVPLSLMERLQATETDAEDPPPWAPRSKGWTVPSPCGSCGRTCGRCPCGPVSGSTPRRSAGCWGAAATPRRPAARWRPPGPRPSSRFSMLWPRWPRIISADRAAVRRPLRRFLCPVVS